MKRKGSKLINATVAYLELGAWTCAIHAGLLLVALCCCWVVYTLRQAPVLPRHGSACARLIRCQPTRSHQSLHVSNLCTLGQRPLKIVGGTHLGQADEHGQFLGDCAIQCLQSGGGWDMGMKRVGP